eukprot:1285583-Ditylum_brightwellii.AAC.1
MRKNTSISCRKFAAESHMDPYQDGLPLHLPKLSKVKEKLIAHLSEDNSVKGQVNIMEEEELGQEAENILTVARETNISLIQANLGPEQGGASGVNNPDKD